MSAVDPAVQAALTNPEPTFTASVQAAMASLAVFDIGDADFYRIVAHKGWRGGMIPVLWTMRVTPRPPRPALQ